MAFDSTQLFIAQTSTEGAVIVFVFNILMELFEQFKQQLWKKSKLFKNTFPAKSLGYWIIKEQV